MNNNELCYKLNIPFFQDMVRDDWKQKIQELNWENRLKIPKISKVEEVLKKVGMFSLSNKMPHQLSGGEQQCVAIARALLNDPELILADEPTGNLDPQTSSEILELLKKINAQGKTIINITLI